MGSNRDWDEERSVISDKGDIGNVDFQNDGNIYNYDAHEGPIIISVPFPLMQGRPQSVVEGERIYTPITIQNNTDDAVDLWSVKIYDSKPKDSFTLSVMEPPSQNSDQDYRESFIESFCLEDRMLRAGRTLTIWLSCNTKVKGLHTSAVHFSVGDETIERMAFLMAENTISQSLASDRPYNRPRRNNKQLVGNVYSLGVNNVPVNFVRGARPAKASSRGFRYKLPAYLIPDNIRQMIEKKQTPDSIIEGLTKVNYVSFFTTLVIMEELKVEEDMRAYDMKCVTMKRKGYQFLSLEVPGLAERRPSIVYGDSMFAKLSNEVGNDSSPAYQGYIHRIEAEEVYLQFDDEFHEAHHGNNRYDVTFSYNRLNMRRLYQAIEAAERLEEELLFPAESSRKREIETKPLVPFSCMLNEEQLGAVQMILGCKGGPPYVIHGPPGTGKTVTLTEAVLQLYSTRKNARMLVCAPSNSAADHILKKILVEKAVKLQEHEIFRLNAQSRPVEEINPEYRKYCYVDDQEGIFKCPLFEDLSNCRIIISTYTSASHLYAEGIRKGQFTHIFLDEAGQASEPETMIPLSHLYRRDTVVVLAGDQMQLGPVIYSKTAEMYGLGKSYLERLFECTFYSHSDENYVTKLLRNYRSHAQILQLPSELFYNSELIPCKDKDANYSFAWLNLIPNKEFPMLFTGVQGVDEREGNNPSWFNRIEASEVVEIILSLTNRGLSADDIGVITPYRQQVLKIRKALESFVGTNIKVGTVEQFQGQEREVIIISTVRSTIKHNDFDRIHCLGFLSNPRRFNVAITRARSLLIVVGNPHILCKDQHWNKFLWHCSDNGAYQGCFLPDKQEVLDEYCGYEAGSSRRPSEDVAYAQEYQGDSNFRPSEDVGLGQGSSQWDYIPEIPEPVQNEDEWSDGWK